MSHSPSSCDITCVTEGTTGETTGKASAVGMGGGIPGIVKPER